MDHVVAESTARLAGIHWALVLSQAFFAAWRENLRRPLAMCLPGFYCAYVAVQYWLK